MKRSIFIVALLIAPNVYAQGGGAEVLFGIVHTGANQPIPNVRVTISNASGSSTVVSGSAGQFQFRRIAPGTYSVTVSDPAYRLKEPVRVLVSDSTRLNLELTLKEEARPAPVRRGVLSGVLRTVDGSPASGIVLTISGPAGSDEVVTTRAGEYRLGELLPGMYRIHIEEQGFAVDDTDGIVINPGEETHLDLSLTLHEIVQVVAFSPDATLAASTPGMSTRVVEAEEIAEREASSFVAIMRDLPGVAVSRKGGVGSETFAYIRGGASNYALVLLDGLPVNDPGGAFDFGKLLPLDIGRVEVTRGAASSIYGGALSGVVQLSTRQAGPDERKFFVSGEGGGFSWNRIQGGTSGRTDTLDWNLGLIQLQTDNQVPNNAFSQIGAAGSLGAQLSDDTSLRFIFRGESRTDTLDWNLGLIQLQTDNQVPNNAFSQIGAAGSLGAQLSDDTSLRFIFRGESSEVGTPGPSYTNLGKTRGQGFELSFGASPFRALRFRGDYTWLDTSVLEGNTQFVEGDPLPNRPRHQVSLSAQSELGRVTLGGTFLFASERRAEADFVSLALGLTTIEAYSRFDFRSRVALTRGLEAYVAAENLFDRQYEEVLGYPALGRSVRVGISWEWNMR